MLLLITGSKTACLKAVGTQPDNSDAFIRSKQGPTLFRASLIIGEERMTCRELQLSNWSIIFLRVGRLKGSNCLKAFEIEMWFTAGRN